MERTFDRFFTEPFELAWYGRNGKEWFPKLDVLEQEDAVTVCLELAGVSPENVDVSIRDNVLTISGHKDFAIQDEGKDFYICEREFGSFRRVIELPPGCDAEHITASQANGVVTIKIARSKEAKPRHIPVKTV
jgi:HSP20 family protein